MKSVNRRNFLKLSGAGVIGLTLGGVALRATAQEKLSPEDPTAVALKYIHQSKLDGKNCANCMYIQGENGEDWRPCAIFPGKVVAAKGYCSAWLKKG